MLTRNPNFPPSEEPFVRRTLAFGCALSMAIIMVAWAIFLALLILKLGRAL